MDHMENAVLLDLLDYPVCFISQYAPREKTVTN